MLILQFHCLVMVLSVLVCEMAVLDHKNKQIFIITHIKKYGLVGFFYVFERSLICSPRLHTKTFISKVQ